MCSVKTLHVRHIFPAQASKLAIYRLVWRLLHYLYIDFCVTFITTLLAGQKHPRDPWGELDETSPKTPRNACE